MVARPLFLLQCNLVTCCPYQDKNWNLEQEHLLLSNHSSHVLISNVLFSPLLLNLHSSHVLFHFSGIFSLYSFSKLSIIPLHSASQSPFQSLQVQDWPKIFLMTQRSGRRRGKGTLQAGPLTKNAGSELSPVLVSSKTRCEAPPARRPRPPQAPIPETHTRRDSFSSNVVPASLFLQMKLQLLTEMVRGIDRPAPT